LRNDLANVEAIVKTDQPLDTKKPEAAKSPDLRNGVHGSLTIEGIDAGKSSQPSDADLKITGPDQAVPVGQTTHE
jgi:hypothetical protein